MSQKIKHFFYLFSFYFSVKRLVHNAQGAFHIKMTNYKYLSNEHKHKSVTALKYEFICITEFQDVLYAKSSLSPTVFYQVTG